MHLRKALSLGVAAGLLAVIAAIPASAQTFAAFAYDGTGNVVYSNASGNSSTPAPVAVIFSFNQAGFGPGLLQPNTGPSVGLMGINAMFTYTGTRTGPAVPSALGADQPYIINGFEIRRTSDNALLLGGSGSPADFHVGAIGGTTADLSASKPPAANVSFTSDFVTFPAATSASIIFGFTEPAPNPITIGANGNYVGANPTDLLLNPSGNFTFTPAANPVPEPGTVALFSSLAVCGSVFGVRRLRRRK